MEHGLIGGLVILVVFLLYWCRKSEQRRRAVEVRLYKLMRHVGFEADATRPVTADVKILARTPGGKIPAIRLYRQQTGAGLKQAKEAVERLMEPGA